MADVNMNITVGDGVQMAVQVSGPPGTPGDLTAFGACLQFGDGDSVLTAGSKKVRLVFPFEVQLTAVRVSADTSGSAVLDFKVCAFASYPGSLVSIVGSTPPTLSSAISSVDTTLTGWTPSIPAGSILEISLASVSTCRSVAVALAFTRII